MRFVLPLAAVAFASLTTYWLGSDPVVAALGLIAAVIVSAAFDRVAGLFAAVLATISLVWLTALHDAATERHIEGLEIAIFAIVAILVATIVTRERRARRTARLAERETEFRIRVTDAVMRGMPVSEAVDMGARGLSQIYELAACTLATSTTVSTVERHPKHGRLFNITTGKISAAVTAREDLPLNARTLESLTVLVTTLGVLFDRATLEQELDRTRIDFETNKARAVFFAAAGHNLRTPLASIRVSLSTLLDAQAELIATEREELIQTAYDEMLRLENLVTNILHLSRVRSDQSTVDLQPVDLGEIIKVTVNRIEPIAPDHTLVVDLPAALGMVPLCQTMIEQVLTNLLENAVRWAPPESPVTIEVLAGPSQVRLSVIDRGPGVPAGAEEEIFSEFFHLAPGDPREGSGLGLAIARAMVEAHKGQLRYGPTPGGGATFTAEFPVVDPTSPTEHRILVDHGSDE